MNPVRNRRVLSVAAQIALLSLGVSAVPFTTKAQEADEAFVWGVAARDAAVADANAPLLAAGARSKSSGQGGGIGPLAVGSTGSGITIAILDTGVDLDHPEFAGRIAAGGTCFGGVSVCFGLGLLGDDDDGHGTHVAGIAAAADDGLGNTGVAPEAMILPVKVLGAAGGTYTAVGQGIEYASAQGAQVINLSLGGPRPSIASDYNTLVNGLQAAAQTSVIVAAAGNSGNGRIPDYPAAFATTPGIVGSMIIAGSLRPNSTVLSRFSNTPGEAGCAGPRSARVCFKHVFLVAPGEKIYSTYPGGTYGTASGTSMATPYIAGAAAVVFSAAPYLTPQEVASILFTSAIDLGRPGTDPVYGRGLVNPVAAIAPLGTLSIATSGPSTSSLKGTGHLGTSALGGVLANGLRASHAAHDVVFFDAFKRDFRVDVTTAMKSGAVSLDGVLDQGPALRMVSFAGEHVFASAFVGEDAGNLVALSGGQTPTQEWRNAVVSLRLSGAASVTLGVKADAAGRVNQLDLAASEAYDGLLMSATAMNSPYFAFASEASLVAASVPVAEDVTLTFGHVSQDATHDAFLTDEVLTADEQRRWLRTDDTHVASGEGNSAALAWRFASWGIVGVNAGHIDEQNALLGGVEGGALALTSEAETTTVGTGLRINLDDSWIASAAWSGGVSRVTPLAGGLFANISELETSAYGVALAHRGIFGAQDSIGLAVSRPLHIVSGQAVFVASTGVTESREIVYTTEALDLASATPQTDFEIGYFASIGAATLFQVNAIYQQDLDGVSGRTAIAGLATLKTVW